MVVYPLAGDAFDGDLEEFKRMGIKVDYSGNVKFMQVPIVGSEAFIKEWVGAKMGIIKRVLHGVRGLSSKHVALFLLKGAGDACRVVYYLRTSPLDILKPFVAEFDSELRDAVDEVLGVNLSEGQWEQATLGVKQGGMGFCKAADIADAAYLASRAGTYDDCKGLDDKHVWDDGRHAGDADNFEVLGEWLVGATRRFDVCVPPSSRIGEKRGEGIGKQKDLVGKLQKLKFDRLFENSNEVGRSRLNGAAAPRAGVWLDTPPNRGMDLKLTNAEIHSRAGRRLGFALCEEGPCPFCFGIMDKYGIHAESCTAGGDKTMGHHIVRDDLHRHARRARAAPVLEAAGVLDVLGVDVGVRRVQPNESRGGAGKASRCVFMSGSGHTHRGCTER